MNDGALAAGIAGIGMTAILAILAAVLIPKILYFLTLQRVMNKLSPANKPFAGELIWIGLIPGVGDVWYLVYVALLSNALQKDYTAVGQVNNGAMPIAIGLIVAAVLCVVPLVNLIAVLALFVLWIIHWVKMTEYNRRLPVNGVVVLA